MRTSRWLLGLAGLALLASVGLHLGKKEPVARAGTDPAPVVAPRVVMLSGQPGSTRTEVMVASPGTNVAPQAFASLDHLPGAIVKGAVLPGGSTAVVVADTLPARELSWAASLLLVEPGLPPRQLVDRVYHASRPLVSSDGRVFVQRGTAGSDGSKDGQKLALRVDELAVDEVDLSSGSTRTILSWQGHETHLAGQLDHEIIVYRVGPQGADLVAVHMDTAHVRVVVPSWPPMARDFSVDESGRGIVAQQLDDGPPRQWVVQHVSLDTGARRTLASSTHRDLVPYVFPDGAVLVNPPDRRGPSMLSSPIGVKGLGGPGVMWLRTTSPDRNWITGTWAVPGTLPVGIVVRASDGKVLRVPSVEGHRVDVIGVVGGAS
jgi:dipeptidyl aminopeptidase/acylaminoacyl peptidase